MEGIQSMLFVCSERFPETREMNESAYKASVFSQPEGDAFLRSGIHDFEIDKTLQSLIDGQKEQREMFIALDEKIVLKFCVQYPSFIQTNAIHVFGFIGGKPTPSTAK